MFSLLRHCNTPPANPTAVHCAVLHWAHREVAPRHVHPQLPLGLNGEQDFAAVRHPCRQQATGSAACNVNSWSKPGAAQVAGAAPSGRAAAASAAACGGAVSRRRAPHLAATPAAAPSLCCRHPAPPPSSGAQPPPLLSGCHWRAKQSTAGPGPIPLIRSSGSNRRKACRRPEVQWRSGTVSF